jgi:hypothetical protein
MRDEMHGERGRARPEVMDGWLTRRDVPGENRLDDAKNGKDSKKRRGMEKEAKKGREGTVERKATEGRGDRQQKVD